MSEAKNGPDRRLGGGGGAGRGWPLSDTEELCDNLCNKKAPNGNVTVICNLRWYLSFFR